MTGDAVKEADIGAEDPVKGILNEAVFLWPLLDLFLAP
jgi:hypothetical protein